MSTHTQLFIDGFSHIDCAYLDPVHGLVGESWNVDAVLGGELDASGMICDFGVVKQRLKQALDEIIDHKLILAADSDIDRQSHGADLEIVHADRMGRRLRYRAPRSAICELDAPNANPATLEHVLAAQIRPLLPGSISQLSLRLRPPVHRNQYRYCHGLRKHEGNCQRMAHGHRAHVEIRLDNRPAPWLETNWAQRLGHKYIGSESDLRPSGSVGRLCFVYEASQGVFELELPEDRAYVIDADATVECLSAHIAEQVAANNPNCRVEVTTLEGISKGAISCANS